MWGSQALETAIGLVLMFFVISLTASSIIEIYSRLISKRASSLENTIASMLAGRTANTQELTAALNTFQGTAIYDAIDAAAGRSFPKKKPKRPSYLSAKSFADAVCELLFDQDGLLKDLDSLPAGLRRRLIPIIRESRGDLLAIKAGVERWYDETMERLEGAYKRWATALLFVVGLLVAVGANASTFDTAHRLWQDPATREIVATSATGVAAGTASDLRIGSVADAVRTSTDLGLPLGWDDAATKEWSGTWANPATWGRSQLATALGWLVTGLLVTLGAPFWFDLLTRLVSLRSSGSKPATAAKDPTSSTARLASGDPGRGGPAAFRGGPGSTGPGPGTTATDLLRHAFGLPAEQPPGPEQPR